MSIKDGDMPEHAMLYFVLTIAVLATILKLNPGWNKKDAGEEKYRGFGTKNKMDLFGAALGPWLGLVLVLVMLVCPLTTLLVQHTQIKLEGSLVVMLGIVKDFVLRLTQEPVTALREGWMWTLKNYGDDIPRAARLVAKWWLFQAALMIFVPGNPHNGPVTENGHVPKYTENGIAAFFISVVGLPLAHVWGWVDLTEPYEIFGALTFVLNIYALALTLFLWVKGHVNPSGPDSGSLGSLGVDLFWGMELYPRVFGFDLKMFTNCRFGLMAWTILPISYCFTQYEMYGEVSPALLASTGIQVVYMYKFYLWEMGYMHTMDIQHDRFGFYEGWGCSAWVPVIYTSHSLYLVEHARDVSAEVAFAIFAIGVYSVFVNYEADWQRQIVRANDAKLKRSELSLLGNLLGHKADKKEESVRVIRAKYNFHDNTTSKVKVKKSILLVDGWWATVRHFHYIPELTASLCWCLPALNSAAVPYFYVFYLALLLVDRAFRDDRRCQKKYGKYWEQYCKKVPYVLIPGIA
eukprot:g3323.t1